MPSTATIRKEFTFEASHVLPNHDGKCSRMHGHSYKVEAFLTGPISEHEWSEKHGMVFDFGDLTRVVQEQILDRLDHRHLNDLIHFNRGADSVSPGGYFPPSAENIARYIFDCLDQFELKGMVKKVRVWEGYKSYAEVEA